MSDFENKFVSGNSLVYLASKTKEYIDEVIENVNVTEQLKDYATQEYVMQYVEENQLAKNNGSVALLTIQKADMDIMLEDGESELIFSKITYDENRTYYIEYDGKIYPSTSVSRNYIEFNYYADDGFYVELDNSYSNSTVMCFYYFKYYLGYVDPEDYEEEPPMPTTATDMVIKYDDVKYLDNNLLDENLQVKNSVSVGIRKGEIGGSSITIGANNQASHSNSFAQGEGSVASGLNSFASGSYTTASAPQAHAEGSGTTASKVSAHAEGNNTTASNSYAHAEGNETTASGSSSHAEGSSSTAKGTASHAEGVITSANGYASHAEGSNTNANGDYTHTEGYYVTANGSKSHAEGSNTRANGEVSHAEGYYTIASGQYQHVQGKFNIEDAADTYAHIVGNGSGNARSNAHTLDWDGNGWFAGNVTIGTDNKELATKEYVDSIKSDWDEIDPNSPSYIKNRTHGLVKATSTLFEADAALSNGMANLGFVSISFEEGKKYYVTFNNIRYECDIAYSNETYFMGNTDIVGNTWGVDIGNGEPFEISFSAYGNRYRAVINTSDEYLNGTYHLKIEEDADGVAIKKLDEKYLPDAAATKAYVDDAITLDEDELDTMLIEIFGTTE